MYDTSLLIGANFANGGMALCSSATRRKMRSCSRTRFQRLCDRFERNGVYVWWLKYGVSRQVLHSEHWSEQDADKFFSGNTRAFNASLDQYNRSDQFFSAAFRALRFQRVGQLRRLPNVNLYSEFSFHDDRTVAAKSRPVVSFLLAEQRLRCT